MDTLHKVGDVVICVHARGYQFTEGKKYTVEGVVPPTHMENNFTFPSYVQVRDDRGNLAECHHNRFRPSH